MARMLHIGGKSLAVFVGYPDLAGPCFNIRVHMYQKRQA